jgi:thioredoxin-like negative regulator of GroEL
MKPILTYFHGKGCGSCRNIQPIIDEVKEVLNLNLVNTYEDTILTEQFEVEYIPTLIIEDENGIHVFEGPTEIKEVIKKLIL